MLFTVLYRAEGHLRTTAEREAPCDACLLGCRSPGKRVLTVVGRFSALGIAHAKIDVCDGERAAGLVARVGGSDTIGIIRNQRASFVSNRSEGRCFDWAVDRRQQWYGLGRSPIGYP